MINLRLITFLATLAYTQSTLATINIIVPSNLNITNVSVSGPSCSTRNSSPPITMNEKSDTSTGSYTTVGFDAMGASAIPGKNEVSWTDCTMSVDFIYPQGFQMAGLTAVTHGFVAFEMGGMVQEISLDMWFPSLPFLVITNATRIADRERTGNFDLQGFMNIQGSFWDACAGQSQFKVRVRQNATVITTNVAKDVPNGGRTIIDDITVLLDQGKDGGRFGSC